MTNISLEQQSAPEPVATDLISLVMGSQPTAKGADQAPSEPPVERVGNVPLPDFSSALETATGGAFKSIDDLRAAQQAAQREYEYQAKVSELEAKVQGAFKPVNDFVAKLNDLLASGADAQKVENFWRLANTDLNSMTPLDLLVFQKQVENPGLSASDLRAYVLAEYGLDGDDVDINALPGAKAAKLQIDANAARQKLQAERVALEQVAPKGADPNAEAMRQVQGQAAAAFWNDVLVALPATVNFKYEDKERGIPAYTFEYKPKPEVVDAARQAVLQDVMARPDQYPKTQEGAQRIKEAVDGLVAIYSREEAQRAMFLDLWAALNQQAVLKNAGPIPNRADIVPPAQEQKLPPLADMVTKGKR